MQALKKLLTKLLRDTANKIDAGTCELSEEEASPKEEINSIWNHINTDAKAFTFSNINLKISIVGFNEHKNKYDYINSIVHECEHIKQSMLKAYYINDSGEPPAYTIGYLVSKMLLLNNKLCY